MEPLGQALPILEFAKAETQKRAPHLTHPLLCLDAIRVGVEQGGHAGLQQASLPRPWLREADAVLSLYSHGAGVRVAGMHAHARQAVTGFPISRGAHGKGGASRR